MKTNYLIFGILAIILLVIGILVYTSQKTNVEDEVISFTIDNPDLKPEDRTVLSKIPLDESSARILAEKAVASDECLIFDSIEKRIDSRNGEEFWSAGFSCTAECDEKTINCGAAVMIKENTHEILVGFPD